MESIDMLINDLESEILKAKKATFSNTDIIVNKNTVLALISQIRSNLPIQIQEANEVLKQKDDVLEQANAYANDICQKAVDKANYMITQTEIFKLAEEQCKEMGSQAEENCRKLDYEARSSAYSILDGVSKALQSALMTINDNKNKLVEN